MRWVGPALVALAATAAAVAHSGARSSGLDGEAEGAAQRRALGGEAAPLPSSYVSTFEIVATFPHDTGAFTQGLAFDAAGNLYESDGLYGHSKVRSVNVPTGGTGAQTANLAAHFAEGIEVIGDRMLQLTWRERQLHEYRVPSLEKISSTPLRIGAEGWGLTSDGQRLFITDSTDKLFHAETTPPYAQLASMRITDARLATPPRPIHGVNELEMVGDELWGNIYPMYQRSYSECIVRIDPQSGNVLGWIDMRGLAARQRAAVRASPSNLVLNGIAYHAQSGRLYVTGKQWDHMYQVRIKPAAEADNTPEHVNKVCGLG